MTRAPDGEIRLFLGNVGYGKSVRMEIVTHEMVSDGFGAAIVAYPHFRDGIPVNSRGERVWHRAEIFKDVDHYRRAWEVSRVAVFAKAHPQELAALASEMGQKGKHVIFACDEGDRLLQPGVFLDDPPFKKGTKPELGPTHRLVTEGRHEGVSLLLGARKPTALHDEVVANAKRVYLFNLCGRAHKAWVDDVCGTAYAQKVPILGVGAYLLWMPGPPTEQTHSPTGEPWTFAPEVP